MSLVLKHGASAYRNWAAVRTANGPRGALLGVGQRGFVANGSTNTVSELDLVSGSEWGRIGVGWGPRGLGLVDGRFLLVANSGSDTVSVVDLTLRTELVAVPVGRDPRQISVSGDGADAYVVLWGAGCVSRLDLTPLRAGRPELVREVDRFSLGTGVHPCGMAVAPGGRRAVVACRSLGWVAVLDLIEERVLCRIEVPEGGGRSVAFIEDGEYALVTLEHAGAVAVLDMLEMTLTRCIPVGPSPTGIAVDEEDGTLYCTLAPRSVAVVHLAGVDLSNEDGAPQYEYLTVGAGPSSVCLAPLPPSIPWPV
ncbi:YncE family protein [Streptomyces atratus]|uniref:YncE family protein n=1 Tax=Streptomyces atratus TaxID=1893 RepID=UPI00368B297F